MVLQWCCSGVTVFYNGVTMVLHWCYKGVEIVLHTLVLQWCYTCVTIVLFYKHVKTYPTQGASYPPAI
jgi:hypothetical protein